ncbi:putative signal transducing protein [Flavobacterium notoginsengisoli]|uniref:putative signal transducing protein n=1 Tax=Flavobacterium notoginsengisoli TaxID=1478199 RepID=UPI00362EBF39
MTEIFKGSYIEVMNVKNLLENAGIQTFIANENMSIIQPWSISSGGYNPAILKVQKEDYEIAGKIIKNYHNGEYSLEE